MISELRQRSSTCPSFSFRMSSSSAARALGEAMVFEARQELQPAVDKFQALQRLGNSAPPPSICSDTHPFSNTLSSLPQGSSTATPNSPAPSSNSPLDLIQHLSKRSTKIVRYLSSTKPVEFGLVPECIGNNPRVVQHDTGSRSSTSKFREGLARRSLALSFCRWQFEIYGTSRVGELANNLSAAQTRQDGYIKQYLDANSNRFPDQRARKAATDKISLGTKYLVFELLLRIKSISAILIFEHSRFRGIKFEKLNDLMNLVRSTSWIMELAKRREKWFDECLEQYNSTCLLTHIDAAYTL